MSTPALIAIDPGTAQSGWCQLQSINGKVHSSGVLPNDEMLREIHHSACDVLAIEMVASYGMPVGREVFETVRWIGRFQQAWRDPETVILVYRQAVKLHLCKSARAKDSNIRQALLDRFGRTGTKGVTGHAWAALAVAVTVYDNIKGEQ